MSLVIEAEILVEIKKLNSNIERISNIFFDNEFPNQKKVIDKNIEKNILAHFTKKKLKNKANNGKYNNIRRR